MELVVDAAVIGIVPGVVEIAKRAGLPTRFAGVAAVVAATIFITLSDVAQSGDVAGSFASWVLRGIVTGLAASGLYSQAKRNRSAS